MTDSIHSCNYECQRPACVLRQRDELVGEIERLRAELETERMRLAACGVVALTNTPESASKAREMRPEYRSASLDDVERAVDEQMRLRAELAEAHSENAEQARLLGISGSVEARLLARVAAEEEEVERLQELMKTALAGWERERDTLERECDARDETIRILDEERDKLRAELAEVKRDAERYRWLRDSKIADDADRWICAHECTVHEVAELDGERLDAAIDRARGAE